MKKVEFIGRFANRKKKSKADKEDDYINSLIGKSLEEDEPEIEFMYDPITLDIEKVDEHIRLDRGHTQLNMTTGKMYIVKVPYDQFTELYQQLTGTSILKVQMVTTDPKKKIVKNSLFGDMVEDEQDFTEE